MLSIGTQINNKKSKILLLWTFSVTGKIVMSKCIEKMHSNWDSYGNKNNTNKELYLLFEDCFKYNIFWPNKSNIVLIYLN